MTVPEAAILADLRKTHAQLKSAKSEGWSMRLTVEEVDTLLAIVDERDELRRQGVGDLEAPFAPVEVKPFSDLATKKSPLIAQAEAALEPIVGVIQRIAEGCPRRGTIHDCPLGGCPTPVRDLDHEQRETPPEMVFDEARHTWLCGAPKEECSTSCACDCHTTNERRMTPLNGWIRAEDA